MDELVARVAEVSHARVVHDFVEDADVRSAGSVAVLEVDEARPDLLAEVLRERVPKELRWLGEQLPRRLQEPSSPCSYTKERVSIKLSRSKSLTHPARAVSNPQRPPLLLRGSDQCPSPQRRLQDLQHSARSTRVSRTVE
ncbi:hypothetical protein BJY59DRAFT_35231 [Rhodotorula toruloides]